MDLQNNTPVADGQQSISRSNSIEITRIIPVSKSLRQITSVADTGVNMLQRTVFEKATEKAVSKKLGWFSIGLGLVEFLTPGLIAGLLGLPNKNNNIIRLFGLREIASGVAIFSQGTHPTKGVWSRVAGDAMDLSALAACLATPGSSVTGIAIATANVLAVTAVDLVTARQLSQSEGSLTPEGAVRVKKTTFVNRSKKEVYDCWRDLQQLPLFMHHLESVEVLTPQTSRWTAKGPGGTTVSWEAKIIRDVPGELIEWRSIEGTGLQNSGVVRFTEATGQRGTFVTVEIEYNPPAGVLGAGIARMLREDPLYQLRDDLRRFKQYIEVGEIVHSDGSPEGNGKLVQRPAQPQAA